MSARGVARAAAGILALCIGCTDTKQSPALNLAALGISPGHVLPSGAKQRGSERHGLVPMPPMRDGRDTPATPSGFVRMTVGGFAPSEHGGAVLLVDEAEELSFPIFVSEAEAMSIRLRLENRRFARPLTHDLLDALLAEFNGQLESVRLEKVEHDVYFAKLVLRQDNRRIELDARSSDAIALALGVDAPIFVAKRVLEDAGKPLTLPKPEHEPPAAPNGPVQQPTPPGRGDPISI